METINLKDDVETEFSGIWFIGHLGMMIELGGKRMDKLESFVNIPTIAAG